MSFLTAYYRGSITRTVTTALAVLMLLSLFCADEFAAKRSRGSSRKSRAESRGRGGRRSIDRRKGRGRRGETASRGRRGRRGRRSRRHRSYDVVDAQSARVAAVGISAERTTEIQNALIKLGYLDGPASGQWDDRTQEAVKDFQSD